MTDIFEKLIYFMNKKLIYLTHFKVNIDLFNQLLLI